MIEADIPDFNIFMMCHQVNELAYTDLSNEFYFRNCKPEELEIWKAFPFDSEKVPTEYEDFMNQYIDRTYGENIDLFFQNTFFVCTQDDRPIATCSFWKAYGKINTIQWFKTHKDFEGKGIGRALLSKIMKCFNKNEYPIYLHTQPGSYRAIKLYSDFGFCLLKGEKIGNRINELDLSLPILKQFVPLEDFEKFIFLDTPISLISELENETEIQF
jgi:GNAT superfamily N-acetyltransferase